MSLEYNNLKDFSEFVRKIRDFFHHKNITEVFTDPLMPKRVPDMGVDMIKAISSHQKYYLHSSPEWEMKKLLANHSGDIYQLVHVFRDDPVAKWHKPAFLMLEWYQLGIDEQALIEVCCELFAALGLKYKAVIHHLPDLFFEHCQINVHQTSIEELRAYCEQHKIEYTGLIRQTEISSWIDLIWVNQIEVKFNRGLHIVDRYLSEQSALANVISEPYPYAQRFEIYINGCEVANGYNELRDPRLVEERLNDLGQRMGLSKESIVDYKDIEAMPRCSGVSVGVERLYSQLSTV
jgi:lysyl-tRNA synthetase class 2